MDNNHEGTLLEVREALFENIFRDGTDSYLAIEQARVKALTRLDALIESVRELTAFQKVEPPHSSTDAKDLHKNILMKTIRKAITEPKP